MSICGTCNNSTSCLTCKYTDTNRLGVDFACACKEGYKEDINKVC